MAQQVIVSIASWPPRIPYVEACVKSLLDQSRKPNESADTQTSASSSHSSCR